MEIKANNFQANKPPNAFIEETDDDGDNRPYVYVSCSLENPDFDDSQAIGPNNYPFIDWSVPQAVK